MSRTGNPASEPPVGDDVWDRRTAPQSPYSVRQVAVGLVVFVIGAVVAFGIPLVMI